MINSLKAQQKAKVNTVYHNYNNISTKNFDGRLLYQLFLACGDTSKRNFKSQKTQRRLQIRSESRKQPRITFKSQSRQSNKNFGRTSAQNANRNLINIITSQHDYNAKSTQETSFKLQLVNLHENIGHRQLYSAQKFYQTFYKSMQTKRVTNATDQVDSKTTKTHQKMNFASKFKRPPSRKKQSIKIQDFVKAESIEADPWIEGKLGGFSAQFISIISNTKRIYSYQGDTRRQIASLTKIMTCITTLFLAKKHELNIKTQEVKVSRRSTSLFGTTAELETGDVLTIYELLHGMMLPSGNDAAQALADYFDKFIQQKQKRLQICLQTQNLKNKQIMNTNCQSVFLKQMNNLAEYLSMKNTHFSNVHGLSNKQNYSTANDIAELCHYAMKNDEFRQIVKCKQFDTKIYSSKLRMKRSLKWLNTNKLLSLDYCQGIKTGITPTAGPCMAAFFQKQGFPVTIVILNAKNKSKRFQQVKSLYQWAFKQIKK